MSSRDYLCKDNSLFLVYILKFLYTFFETFTYPLERFETNFNMTSIEIVCRFCLRYQSRMWSLKALYEKQATFLEKVYQCTQIKIIDVDELRTWVCYKCYQNIQKFCAFREMLRGNQGVFKQRFEEEQLEQMSVVSSNDHHQVEVFYDFAGDLESYWEPELSNTEKHWWDTGETIDELRKHEDSGFNDDPLDRRAISLENPDKSIYSEMIKCETCKQKYPSSANDSCEESIEDHICIEYN
ncbi:uncharacterized protein LOC131431854 [Malaya genurostris]|uniref:uncharacterized protein LOC131431854 n=1 Tax=Malaya genurostris TaxID=325434 RepID=UPI0026F3D066|nr:uncharacterized protein LOC131431854 [Malaya genurostris]